MEDPNMPHFAELSSATVTWPICGFSNFWGPQPWLLALCQSVAVTQCFIVDDKNKKLVPLCDLFNTGTGFVAELQNKSRENPVFTWRDWHTFYLFEETKNQLDTLTSDIKGNANVVRTKLKCEWNCPSFGTCGRLKLSAVFFFFFMTSQLCFNSHGAKHAQRRRSKQVHRWLQDSENTGQQARSGPLVHVPPTCKMKVASAALDPR